MMSATDLDDDETLLRRLWPARHLVTVDEGGAGGQVLNHAALRWDADGVSMYRESILEGLGLSASAMKDEDYTGIASTTKRVIEQFEVDGNRLFAAIASPIVQVPPQPIDRAHASIVVVDDHGLSKTKLKKAQHKLAREAFTVRAPDGSTA